MAHGRDDREEAIRDGRTSGAWDAAFRLTYRFLRLVDPVIRVWLAGGGLGNVVEVVVHRRHGGRPRSVLLGLLVVDGYWYLGHPNGRAAWVRQLEAAERAELRLGDGRSLAVRAELLPRGSEREAVVRATWSQHLFPGNLLYRAAQEHVRARGRYFRIIAFPQAGARSPSVKPSTSVGGS